MSQLLPVVRYLIVCEDVQTDVKLPRRITLVGLISAIRSVEKPPYPLLYRELCVFFQLTECRGPADVRVEVHHADTDEVVAQSQPRTVTFLNDPLEVQGGTFRLRNCLFPKPGLHWVRFWYNQQVLAQQAFLMR